MGIRKYTMQDRSAKVPETGKYRTDPNLSLQAVEHMTDWTPEQFDAIADMAVGATRVHDGWLVIERTS